MKSIINKLLMGAALIATAGLGACTGDLDQLPNDPSTIMGPSFKDNPRESLGRVLGTCYRGLAVSGQKGPDDDSDIKGIDGGTSQYTRGLFMLNEFTTDECMWVYADAGVPELVQGNWDVNNVVNYGIYSRFYAHIAVCNNFIQLANDLGSYGIPVGGEGDNAISQAEVDQMVREARALRALSYYNVIDLWGRGVVAWDDMAFGTRPEQAESREALYNKVVKDVEEVLAAWPEDNNGANVVYGRIGKDAVEALLCRFYLNSEVWTGTPRWNECYTHAQNIINRHKTGGFRYNGEFTGLAVDYLSVFCGNNEMFMPGGKLSGTQNEILWGIPYNETYTQPYGGTTFLCNGAVKDAGTVELNKGFCNLMWYGLGNGWGCMHARQQFAEKFNFVDGACTDARTYLWLTEKAGYDVTNSVYADFTSGYLPIKFTNLMANEDGTMNKFVDENGLNRAGQLTNVCTKYYVNTDLPLIRLADVYLMAAECTLHGAGNRADGLKYLNIIRSRAAASEVVDGDFNEDLVIDERARELYWECTRRTDLIRFGKFTGGNYSWNWKGGAYNGGTLDPTRNLFPLPANVVAIYGSSMQQNPGY